MKDSPSTFVVTKEIIRTKGFGLNGLNKGLSATVLRSAVFNSVYFGFYHSVKGYLPVNKDPWLEFFTKVHIGDFEKFSPLLHKLFCFNSRRSGSASHPELWGRA